VLGSGRDVWSQPTAWNRVSASQMPSSTRLPWDKANSNLGHVNAAPTDARPRVATWSTEQIQAYKCMTKVLRIQPSTGATPPHPQPHPPTPPPLHPPPPLTLPTHHAHPHTRICGYLRRTTATRQLQLPHLAHAAFIPRRQHSCGPASPASYTPRSPADHTHHNTQRTRHSFSKKARAHT